jgi:hypothetical protein
LKIRRIRKRDGREVPFDKQKIAEAVGKAQAAVGETDALFASEVSDVVELALRRRYQGTPDALPGIEEIQDLVEQALIELGHAAVAKAYILWRDRRARIRTALSVHGESESLEHSARAPRVQASGALESWSKGRIVAALMNEADLPRPSAEQVAARVEERVFDSGLKRISTGLIRELVDNELVELGLAAALRRARALTLPRHDLRALLEAAPGELEEALRSRLLERYALEDLLGEASAEAHATGEFQLVDLGAFHRPLVRSLPLELLLPGAPGGESAFELLAGVGVALESCGRSLVLDDPLPVVSALPRAWLAPWLRALAALAESRARTIDLCLPPLGGGPRAQQVAGRLLLELARLEPRGAPEPALRGFVQVEDLLACAGEGPESARAIEGALASGTLVPAFGAGAERCGGPGLVRAARERGALDCAGAVALNLPRAARRAGPWREDAFFEELAGMLERALTALAELERGALRSRSRREGPRARTLHAVVPVGLSEALRVLGDGELRGEQEGRVLAFLCEALERFGEPHGLALVLTPFFGERARERFAELDAQLFQARQPQLFGGEGQAGGRGEPYSCGFDLSRSDISAPALAARDAAHLAAVMSSLRAGALHPPRCASSLELLERAEGLRLRARSAAHALHVLPGALTPQTGLYAGGSDEPQPAAPRLQERT